MFVRSFGAERHHVDMTMPDDQPLDDAPFSVDLFEVVLVRPGTSDRDISSRGTVLGRTRGDDDEEFYAVFFDEVGETSMIARSDLEPTGERRRREDFYDGTRIRVNDRGELIYGTVSPIPVSLRCAGELGSDGAARAGPTSAPRPAS